ncbi:MAG: VOC family protein [Sideroxyarcus sp.]|nr:VOC family protein [Sideroxyarcus sp.]
MSTVNYIPEGYNPITPYLIVRDCAAAISFYQRVFGAKEIGRISMPDGVIGHAELRIGDAVIMLAEEMPEWNNVSPITLGGSGVGIVLYVPDVDATYRRALDAGAKQIEPVKDMFYGDRSGIFTDPFGHNWHVMTHIENVTFEEIQKRSDAMFAETVGG